MERPREAHTSLEIPAPNTLASKLVFSLNSEVNFERAVALTSKLENYAIVAEIPKSLAEAGKTEEEIKELLGDSLKGWVKDSLSSNIALGNATRGDYTLSDQLLQEGKNLSEYWYIQLGTIKVKNGDDPTTVYKNALKSDTLGNGYAKLKKRCDILASMVQAGINVGSELEDLISNTKPEDMEAHAIEVARVFAAQGMTDRALEFARDNQYYTPGYEDYLLRASARALIKLGKTEEAMDVARKIGKPAYMEEITRKSVLYQAENGIKDEELLAHFKEMSARILNNPSEYIHSKIELACAMAKINRAYGEDTDAPLGLAMNAIAESDEDYKTRIDLLIDVAKTKAELGQNVSPIFGLLFESAEHLYKLNSREDADKIDRLEMLFTVEDLTHTALELGFLNEAERLIHFYLEKLSGEEIVDDVIISQMVMMAKLAVAQAKRGLTSVEISAISSNEVNDLLATNAHKVHEAIGYFGLADEDLIKSQKPQTRVSVAIGSSKRQKDLKAQIDTVSKVYEEDRSVSSTKAFVEGLVSADKDLARERLLSILQEEITGGGDVKVISRLLKGLLEAEDPKAREIAVNLFKNDSYPNNFRVYLARKLCDSGYWDRQISFYFRNYRDTMKSDMRAPRDAQIESLSAIINKMHINPNIDVYKTLEKTRLLKENDGFDGVVGFGAEVLSLPGTNLETKIAIFSFWTNKYLEGEIDHDQLKKLSQNFNSLNDAEEAFFKINKFPKDSYHIQPVVKNLYKSESLSTDNQSLMLLMKAGYFPTERLIDFIDDIGEGAIDQLNTLKEETSDGRLRFDNPIQVDIEYVKYLKLYQGESEDPYIKFLSIETVNSGDIQRELDLHEKMEAEAAAYEAANFYWFVRERVDKGRKVTVVGNQRYGDYFVVNPLRSYLEEIGVTLSSYKIGSSGSSSESIKKVFPPSFVDFITKTHSDVVIVDGTPNISGVDNSSRLPSALYGYYNWFQAYNHAAEATEPQNKKLSESTNFKELSQDIKKLNPTKPYKISFWVPQSKKHISLGNTKLDYVEPSYTDKPEAILVNPIIEPKTDKNFPEDLDQHQPGFLDDPERYVQGEKGIALTTSGVKEVLKGKGDEAQFVYSIQNHMLKVLPKMIRATDPAFKS